MAPDCSGARSCPSTTWRGCSTASSGKHVNTLAGLWGTAETGTSAVGRELEHFVIGAAVSDLAQRNPSLRLHPAAGKLRKSYSPERCIADINQGLHTDGLMLQSVRSETRGGAAYFTLVNTREDGVRKGG